MTVRTTLRSTALALAVAGAAAGASTLVAGTAAAATPDVPSVFPCTSNQFTSKLVYGGAGMGNRYAAIQFTANPGERCTLPGKLDVKLIGAHNVLVNDQAPADARSVALSDGSSAYVPLHWTSIEPTDGQQTPNAVSFAAPSEYNMHGDYINPNIDLPWDLGAVDADSVSHTIDVGAMTQGTAPTA
ncbi:hypothetical protein GCM10010174_46410 [Kutzneria viridogrisea]|uniref:DUF4232 domain-containing protein n=1 Tax=Kutzneria viridogrisea TaxID=47990 RepID=A0ABR6BIH7_9PSEU|nr:hypothetical protein [Kutzneria viridogrisea]